MRDLKLLTQQAQDKHAEFAFQMARAGLNYVVTSTLRTSAEQRALFAQGRETYEVICELRKTAGLGKINKSEAERIVTWTMNSRHLNGTAFDIALIDNTGKVHWNEKVSFNLNKLHDYTEAGLIGESVGLKWGGRFSSPDPCHFEV